MCTYVDARAECRSLRRFDDVYVVVSACLKLSQAHCSAITSCHYVTPFERSDTVMDLKRELQKVFPGHPPASLQRLFRGTQLLSDDVVLGEITIEEEVIATMLHWFASSCVSIIPSIVSNHTSLPPCAKGCSRGGRLQLLLDAPPPVDADTFDPSTVVPSTREALLEAYFSNLMAMQQMQIALSKASAGDPSPFVYPGLLAMAMQTQRLLNKHSCVKC